MGFALRATDDLVVEGFGEGLAVRASTFVSLQDVDRVKVAEGMVVAGVARPDEAVLVTIERKTEVVLLDDPAGLLDPALVHFERRAVRPAPQHHLFGRRVAEGEDRRVGL